MPKAVQHRCQITVQTTFFWGNNQLFLLNCPYYYLFILSYCIAYIRMSHLISIDLSRQYNDRSYAEYSPSELKKTYGETQMMVNSQNGSGSIIRSAAISLLTFDHYL